MQTISGAKFLYTMRPGDTWTLFADGRLVIANGTSPPFVIEADGGHTELQLSNTPPLAAVPLAFLGGEESI